ncbi:MAG TPA: hypothetical protein DER23_08760 [Clostridiales bacterium]|jgi:kynurenine formamidase|nr:hypothetical protein [Clostridiales bacterium]
MKKIIDITGPLYNGMWNYEPPFPVFDMQPLPQVDWIDTNVYCEVFSGLHSQSGTYLETPAHVLGYEKSYPLSKIGLEKLVDIPCTVLKVKTLTPDETGRAPITAEALVACEASFLPHSAILVCCDWGKKWKDRDFLSASPYFTKDAMEYLIAKKPFLVGSDIPRWENPEKHQGFFPDFFGAGILLASPFVHLEKITSLSPRLTILPLNVENTCCAPVRAFVWDQEVKTKSRVTIFTEEKLKNAKINSQKYP